MVTTESRSAGARVVAAQAIGRAARTFPDLGPASLAADALSPADRALATAIHRTTLQRWLTLEYLLNRVSSKPLSKLEPMVRGVMLTGAAQLLFMRGLPDYAVVDESVKAAGELAGPRGERIKGMVNAVLRKAAGLVANAAPDEAWTPARDRLPLDMIGQSGLSGDAEAITLGTLTLNAAVLPHPANLVKYLPIAASHSETLVNRWVKRFGAARATQLCLHGLVTPPTIVAVEPGFVCPSQEDAPCSAWNGRVAAESDRFVVWKGTHEALIAFLTADTRRWVQDPAASVPVARFEAMMRDAAWEGTIIDYCAGRGTKTRQLAAAFPQARILATDVSQERRDTLAALPDIFPNVTVLDPREMDGRRCDLLLLDVPCSNSAVLARRPEARYRLTTRTLNDLVRLQRDIMEHALEVVNSGGHVLYATCSIEPEENEQQAAWLAAKVGGGGGAARAEGTLIHEETILPGGAHGTYHDGGYHAIVQT